MNALRLSAADWCFFNRSGLGADNYYQRLRDAGYQGVEMVDPTRWQAARRAGLTIVNMSSPGMENGLNRVENHAKLLPEIRDAIRRASDNGISHVIVFSGNSMGQDRQVGLANCARALSELASDAESAHVVLTFEMLNDDNHPDYQAHESAFGYQLVERVDSPFVNVLYDVYHMVRMGEDPSETLVPRLPHVAHVHVAGVPTRGFPGPDTGYDYRPLALRVQEAGYSGYWGMEFLPHDDAIDELKRAARMFQAFVEA